MPYCGAKPSQRKVAAFIDMRRIFLASPCIVMYRLLKETIHETGWML
jgi:hypothetical protein